MRAYASPGSTVDAAAAPGYAAADRPATSRATDKPMAPQLLFYDRAVPVSSERHRDLAVATGRDYGFARGANVVPLTTAELAPAMLEYPIVFLGDGQDGSLAAVLGTRDGENLFVDQTGRWQARYVPAFVRRYPFVFASQDDPNRLVLCVDEGSALLNREGRGERLFDSTGERTAYLANVLQFLQRYQMAVQRTRAFVQRMAELELLREVRADIRLGDAGTRQLRGFRTIDREQLKALPAATVGDLFTADGLEAIYLHLGSLGNFQRLGERAAAPGAATAEVDGAATDAIDPGDILLN